MDTTVGSRKSGRTRTYRRYSLEEKRRIVEEAMQPGVSVASVARRHGMNDNMIFGWRKRFREDGARLVPVTVSKDVAGVEQRAGTVLPPTPSADSLIEIRTAQGHVVRIGAGADAVMVQAILATLRA